MLFRVNEQQVVLHLRSMASWDPGEKVFVPNLTSRTRDKTLNFRAPHAGLTRAVITASAALPDTVSEVQGSTNTNMKAVWRSDSLSQT